MLIRKRKIFDIQVLFLEFFNHDFKLHFSFQIRQQQQQLRQQQQQQQQHQPLQLQNQNSKVGLITLITTVYNDGHAFLKDEHLLLLTIFDSPFFSRLRMIYILFIKQLFYSHFRMWSNDNTSGRFHRVTELSGKVLFQLEMHL